MTTKNKTDITMLSVKDMEPHPLLERVGMMEGLSTHFAIRASKSGKNRTEHRERHQQLESDWQALVSSVQGSGILEPIKVCRVDRAIGVFYIVDGRNRWKAAQHAGLSAVPTILVDPSDAPSIIASTVAARRHYTKGATAYLACLLNPEIALENSPGRKSRTECAISMDAVAARFAVSLRTLVQASELYRILDENTEFRADAEADIWAGCGLGGILAGVKSLIVTGQRSGTEQSAEYKRAQAAWGAVAKVAKDFRSLGERWTHLDADQRDRAKEMISRSIAEIPDDVRAALGIQAAELEAQA